MAQQLKVGSSTISTTKKYSFAWCNGGGGAILTREVFQMIPPCKPYGTITSASVFITPHESSNESAASVIKCQCVHHWFVLFHLNGSLSHDHGVMNMILEKDQKGIHISYNEYNQTLIQQIKQNSPDQDIHRKNNVPIGRREIDGLKVNIHNMIQFLAETITEDQYIVCSANCQHFVEDLLNSIGLLKPNPFRIRTCCLTV